MHGQIKMKMKLFHKRCNELYIMKRVAHARDTNSGNDRPAKPAVLFISIAGDQSESVIKDLLKVADRD